MAASISAYYVTTPIYYVNDNPHIGHAYTSIATDVLARFMRLDGYRVMFLTGTDEHGQKVEKAARKRAMDPQAFTDTVSENFRELSRRLNISNDDFIRTTEARHVRAAQALWQRLRANGQIYLDTYAGWYAVRDEAFYSENELYTDADGTKRAQASDAEVEWVEEPSYFFRLSQWQDRLLAYYEAQPDSVMPEGRRNEVISFVRGGLRDLSISRTSFNWGIPVPDDSDHIMYVWLDALTNYLTALGFPDDAAEAYQTFWPADVHFVGKDILRFHAIYWPAFLMAADIAPPKRVFAHGWWTIEGQKMSKSLGNVIWPHEMVERYGLDQTRYFMMREVPFGQDGDFSHQAMVGRINDDLANDFGNLAQRVLKMIQKSCGGQVPEPGTFAESDHALLDRAGGLLAPLRQAYQLQQFHKALAQQWDVVQAANRYIDEQAPWVLRKSDPARMATVLYVLAEVIRHLAILAQPVVPDAANRLLDQLAVADDARTFAALGPDAALRPGTALPAPHGVFPRYVETAS